MARMLSLRGAFILGLALQAVSTVGCRQAQQIPPDELRKLHRFQAGERRTILSSSGKPLDFTEDTYVVLYLPDTGPTKDRFVRIEVVDDVFRGTTSKGEQIEVALDSLLRVMVSARDPGSVAWKVAGWIGLAVAGFVATIVEIPIVVIIWIISGG